VAASCRDDGVVKPVIIIVVLIVVAVLVGQVLRRRRARAAGAAEAVRGELVVTGVQEQWRTGNANDDKINREYDVRLTVDATLTGPGLVGDRRRYDVTLVNRDVPKVVAGARFPCDVMPSDPAVVRVSVRPGGPPERFENGRPVTA
jgi:hypothetical protein